MAMRGSHGTAPLANSSGGFAAPSMAAAAGPSAGDGFAAAGRAMMEDEEMAAAIAASLEGADTPGSSGAEQPPGRPARVDSPAVAAVELQPEPADGSAHVSEMAFRLPSGERVQRRFAGERSLQDAFDYLQIEHGLEPGSYSMVSSDATSCCLQIGCLPLSPTRAVVWSQVEGFPPKKHEENGSTSFVEAGLIGRVQVNITSK